eukprot:2462863-Lingulodinium_polyedra.AAC.1
MNWTRGVFDQKGIRKDVSHAGGHLAAYVSTALVCRAGQKVRNYKVVYNSVFEHIDQTFKHRL